MNICTAERHRSRLLPVERELNAFAYVQLRCWRASGRETTVVVVVDGVAVMSPLTSNHVASSGYLADTGATVHALFSSFFFFAKNYVCMKDMKINLYLSS